MAVLRDGGDCCGGSVVIKRASTTYGSRGRAVSYETETVPVVLLLGCRYWYIPLSAVVRVTAVGRESRGDYIYSSFNVK